MVLGVVIALATAGCGSKESVEAENESAQSVARKVQQSDIRLRPGRWETGVRMTNIQAAGMPSDAAKAMSESGSTQNIPTCLTPEDVSKTDGSLFQQAPDDCKYERFSMGGGRIEGVLACTGDQKINMTMNGTYTAETYDLTMNTQTDMGGGRKVKMDMIVTSRRTGECNGTELGDKP
jgi:hypothetical protein